MKVNVNIGSQAAACVSAFELELWVDCLRCRWGGVFFGGGGERQTYTKRSALIPCLRNC